VIVNLYGADLTGKWTGLVVMDGRGYKVFLTLDQHGQTLSGTMSIGDSTNPAPIEAVALHGDQLTFEARDAARMVEFRMGLEDVADGVLSGEASFTDGTANVTFCQVRDFGSGSLYQYLVHPIEEGSFFSALVQPTFRKLVKPEYTE